MSKEYLDRIQQNNTDQNTTDVSQKKIDPVAQLKWINNSSGDQGFEIYGDRGTSVSNKQTDQKSTRDEEDQEQDKGINEKGDIEPISIKRKYQIFKFSKKLDGVSFDVSGVLFPPGRSIC